MIILSQASGEAGIEVVGGKAASLLALTRRGFRVPGFIVIGADEYRSSPSGRVSAELRSQLLEALVPIGGPDREYAVRSSGLAEDSADFSYAGVFETVLGMTGEAALVDAIERCWASHRGRIADAYRSRRGVTDDSSMAVVVQRMVRADWAGVSFSADPLTQALSVCVINATPGLGEELVSGRVNPEEIRIESTTGRILDHRIPAGVAALPVKLRDEVLRQTQAAAAAFGFPQDLEWAAEGDELFLLQSRPITTVAAVFHNRALEPWEGQGHPDAADRVWTRAYADEVWSPPLTPLFYDIQNLTAVTRQQIANGGDSAPVPVDIFKYFKAAAYMDVEVLGRLYATLPPLARRPSLFLLLAPEARPALSAARWNWRGTLTRLWKFEVSRGRTLGLTRNHRFLQQAWPHYLHEARRLADVDLTPLPDAQLDRFLGEVWALALTVAPQCEVAVLYYSHDLRLLLTGLLERWFGSGAEKLYAEVSSGLEHSETVRENEAIWEMARSIRDAGPEVRQRAGSLPWAIFRAQSDPASAPVIQSFDSFLRDHRHRGANYKDMIYPRWGDDPELLWGHLKAFLASDAPRPSAVNAASAQRRLRSQESTLRAVRGQWFGLKRTLLRKLFRLNELYSGLRDNHRFYYDYVWWLVRRVYLEKGRRLSRSGLLSQAHDVVFLCRKELEELRSGTLSTTLAATRIEIRRREWEETRRTPPARFLRRGYLPDEQTTSQQGAARRLSGLAASPGQVRGRARVVLDVAGLSAVADGDILVTRQTDPGWTPAFARLAGLVLETGGVLAHGASLCREYGLPCVTAVEGATALIRDGDTISISGNDGAVEIL
ncbi:MAG TPA: PEP/pyruvate-binding domain-containing protein [Steroidobacteraceae bacterium]|nr:PEP/pyruvate-binding domain-containing protein [Steroidobacteraceae bacterium]